MKIDEITHQNTILSDNCCIFAKRKPQNWEEAWIVVPRKSYQW
jgi:hypothetical protein